MRPYRTLLIAVLALAAGFALASGIFGCHQRINSYPELPGSMVVSPKPGDILTWRRPNAQIKSFTVTVPEQFCAFTSQGAENPTNKTVTVGASGDHVVECRVLSPPNGSGNQVTYFYKVNLLIDPQAYTSSIPAAATSNSHVIMAVPDIAGSCPGCDLDLKARAYSTGDSGIHQIACPNGIPIVVDDPIIVTPDIYSVNWGATGNWTITFPGTSPCNGSPLNGVACLVKSSVRPDPGTSKNYPYTVTVSDCGGGTTPGNGTLTLQGPPATSEP
jgi:hypothetical protein